MVVVESVVADGMEPGNIAYLGNMVAEVVEVVEAVEDIEVVEAVEDIEVVEVDMEPENTAHFENNVVEVVASADVADLDPDGPKVLLLQVPQPF